MTRMDDGQAHAFHHGVLFGTRHDLPCPLLQKVARARSRAVEREVLRQSSMAN